ncbi:MAG TPA: hypothetical protein V6D12_14285 [Candidatus Obscuribacterales bacterium]
MKKTADGLFSQKKVDQFADRAIVTLNSYELSVLVDRLVEFQEGNVQLSTVQRISRAVSIEEF